MKMRQYHRGRVKVKRMKLVCAMARSDLVGAKKEVAAVKTLCRLLCGICKRILVRRGASRKLRKEGESG